MRDELRLNAQIWIHGYNRDTYQISLKPKISKDKAI